jgi:ABC-2 type transport system permease protein
MLTYVFLVLIVRAFVLSSRAIDVSGEIARGELANYLLKPISFFKYYFTKDLSSKSLNLIFAFFEIIILFLILKPPIYLQTDTFFLVGFMIAVVLAIVMYFILTMITSFVPFWIPEAAWGVNFLFTAIFVEFFSGSIFPLDILPEAFYTGVSYTPFPYLIYFPIQIYLGQVNLSAMLRGFTVMMVWIGVLVILMNSLWLKGLRVFQAHGK